MEHWSVICFLIAILLIDGSHHQRRVHRSGARLRHLRHLSGKTGGSGVVVVGDGGPVSAAFLEPHAEALRGPPASIDYTAERSVGSNSAGSSRLTIGDNHKPMFTKCREYRPTVKEEMPHGTFVFVVNATDKDPPEAGGKVTYSFVTDQKDRPKFKIDPETGNITTSYSFDRDEPSREKEVYITVRATDNGRPQLDDTCTIKITIEDTNDNAPIFDKVSYSESMPEDLPANNEVMRVSATDIDDGKNSQLRYKLTSSNREVDKYFRIDPNSGVIFLKRKLEVKPVEPFLMNVTATDQGEVPYSQMMEVSVKVIESNRKSPSFTYIFPEDHVLVLSENFSNFKDPIATLRANSNVVDDPKVRFELLAGRTEQTNKLHTFTIRSDANEANLYLVKPLDYESNSEFTLTIRVSNTFSLAATRTISVNVTDVNDNVPAFAEVITGSVLENEPPGTFVMQVRAIDADGTSENNQVRYKLGDFEDLFQIDEITGNVTTFTKFDREVKDYYNVKINAYDNSPSAIYNNGEPNIVEQVFRIEIADKNDNAPKFAQRVYVSDAVREDINKNSHVIEVMAQDNDTASPVTYSIEDGNIGQAFYIEEATGKIKVNNSLDYEVITNYTLKVRAFDGVYEDYCTVIIKITNVNDNPPVFVEFNKTITISEEKLVKGCIAKFRAIDPDKKQDENQEIVYYVVKDDQRKLLHIDNNGCLSLIKPLDRDPPNGFETWQVIIMAKDDNGSVSGLQTTTEIFISLIDINDNAPRLAMRQPVIWREREHPGIIIRLNATDYDSDENGPPFKFSIASTASAEIRSKFSINESNLIARVVFDREEIKEYFIPIEISDNGHPTMTGTSTLHVVIGDKNDNEMRPGRSSIFVYNYKGQNPDTQIGRVYVDDPDDWDLNDKHFAFTYGPHANFNLDPQTGMITMLRGTTNNTFILEFTVTEESELIPKHTVNATVNVTVKEIPEEAVDKSGSIRIGGITPEEFVAPGPKGLSKRELLRIRLATILNASVENVDLFTVLNSPHNTNRSVVDVRFSAHGSPYYQPELVNRLTSEHRRELEREFGFTVLMVNINECILENNFCEADKACSNFLNKSNVPYAVFTNTSSFIGVRAVVDPWCNCISTPPDFCHNGGTPVDNKCECPEGYEGPHCEILSIGFWGDGWALYSPLQACENSHLSLEIKPHTENGLILYHGPLEFNPHLPVQDFMALELRDGYPTLYMDYGSGTVLAEQKEIKLTDNNFHQIDIYWNPTSIEIKVDSCKTSLCLTLRAPVKPNQFLNVNGPLQLGGVSPSVNLNKLGHHLHWDHIPSQKGFAGCVRNLTFNDLLYNLGMPSDSKNVDSGCSRGMAKAVSFGIDTNFLVAILVCVAILLILLLAVVVHRRKTDDMYKDTDDIRENIINYEDEGGGEGDMTGYDLNVLRLLYPGEGEPQVEKGISKDPLQWQGAPDPSDVPDIRGFLTNKKDLCDNDAEINPYDDLRHYAYEGDGNTTGSLSSLASGTDEGDLDFGPLSNFGPRFRKLQDMFDPSDDEDDEDDGGGGGGGGGGGSAHHGPGAAIGGGHAYSDPASESWC